MNKASIKSEQNLDIKAEFHLAKITDSWKIVLCGQTCLKF